MPCFPGSPGIIPPSSPPPQTVPSLAGGCGTCTPTTTAGSRWCPQLLTNRAEDFIASARLLQDLGYKEVNLNLGCPSGTVVAKKKGAGFLSQPQALARFLDQIFQTLDVNISIKTRIGVENLEEWPPLLDLFQRYPICELIIHPRPPPGLLPGTAPAGGLHLRRGTQPPAVVLQRGPVLSPGTGWDLVRQFPTVGRLMAGRGLVCNPALGRQLQGGRPSPRQSCRRSMTVCWTGINPSSPGTGLYWAR